MLPFTRRDFDVSANRCREKVHRALVVFTWRVLWGTTRRARTTHAAAMYVCVYIYISYTISPTTHMLIIIWYSVYDCDVLLYWTRRMNITMFVGRWDDVRFYDTVFSPRRTYTIRKGVQLTKSIIFPGDGCVCFRSTMIYNIYTIITYQVI